MLSHTTRTPTMTISAVPPPSLVVPEPAASRMLLGSSVIMTMTNALTQAMEMADAKRSDEMWRGQPSGRQIKVPTTMTTRVRDASTDCRERARAPHTQRRREPTILVMAVCVVCRGSLTDSPTTAAKKAGTTSPTMTKYALMVPTFIMMTFTSTSAAPPVERSIIQAMVRE